jgi:hypothetical protein
MNRVTRQMVIGEYVRTDASNLIEEGRREGWCGIRAPDHLAPGAARHYGGRRQSMPLCEEQQGASSVDTSYTVWELKVSS